MVNRHPMIWVENLCLQAGTFRLQEISFRIERGEYFILLGPTGCGKTLLVEAICGLNTPVSGRIHIDGRDVTHIDPARRKIGYVPQDYGLLPFKTVAQNIAFGLEARGLDKAGIRNRLDALFETLDIGHIRDRLPARLSGGERQRVALGRALAIQPDVMVLDEPLSALDEGTCRELMTRLKRLHTRLNTTFIHICHRIEEAITLGNTLAVMRDGRIEQRGTPEQLFSRPRNLFVAHFLQLPNLTKGEVRKTTAGNMFHINEVCVADTDLPEGPAYGVMPLHELTLSAIRPAEREGYVVLREWVAHNSTGPHNPGLRFAGGIGLMLPGIFPANRWPVGQEVYIQFPRSRFHLLGE